MDWLSEVFSKGGPFFIVNTFFLAVVIALIVERAMYFLGRGHLNAKAFLEQIRKNPNGPNPYLYGPERFSRWMDIMIECGRGRLAALGVATN